MSNYRHEIDTGKTFSEMQIYRPQKPRPFQELRLNGQTAIVIYIVCTFAILLIKPVLMLPFLIIVILINIFWYSIKKISNNYTKLLLKQITENDNITSLESIKKRFKKLPKKFSEFAEKEAYWLLIKSTINGVKINDKDIEKLKSMESFIKLDATTLHNIKLDGYKMSYLSATYNDNLSIENEQKIESIQKLFEIEDNEISKEKRTLMRLLTIRKIREGNLEKIDSGVNLPNNETTYHTSEARLLERRVLRSYRQDNITHQEKGLIIKKEGKLFLTSKRLLLISDGTISIPIDHILEFEVDIDKNLFIITKDGREKAIYISVPDSLIFGEKIKTLIRSSQYSESTL